MNTLSNFSEFSLNRSEMKSVTGGTCYAVKAHTDGEIVSGTKAQVKAAAAGGGRWCCQSCGSASWLK